MSRTTICAIFSAFLISGCASEEKADPWALLDPLPVKNFCARHQVPEMTPRGWATCSVVTRADAERLVAQGMLIVEKRK